MNRINIKKLENRLSNASHIKNRSNNIDKKGFEEVLDKIKRKDEDIKFSKHAISRMDFRDIKLDSDEIDRLKSGFNMAEEKGVKEALILIGDKAFVASISNKTVITTVNKEQLKNNVFTNIDGAVIV